MLGIPLKKKKREDPRSRVTISFFTGRPTTLPGRWLTANCLSVLLGLWAAGSLLADTDAAIAFVSFMMPIMPALSSGGPASTQFPEAARLIIALAGASWPVVMFSHLLANVKSDPKRGIRPSVLIFAALLMAGAGIFCIHVINVFAVHETSTRLNQSITGLTRGSVFGLSILESILVTSTGFFFGVSTTGLRNYVLMRKAWLMWKQRKVC